MRNGFVLMKQGKCVINTITKGKTLSSRAFES